MHTSVGEMLAKVRESLGAENVARALEIAESIDVDSLDAPDRLRFYALYSEALHYSGRYRPALITSARCLVEMGDRHDRCYALQKHLHGKILHQLGRLAEAIEVLTESHACLQKLSLFSDAVLPLDSLASLHYQRGDFPATLRTLNQEIKLRLEHGLREDLPRCRNNKARVLIYLGDMLQAGPVLRAVLTENINDHLRYSAAYLQGMIATFKRQHERARTLLGKSLDYYHRTGSAREEVICCEYLGLNEHFAGNHGEARQYYQGILGRDQITASARAQTLRMLTDVHVAEGNYAAAALSADQAEAAINRINERIEAGCLHRSRMRIAAAVGAKAEVWRQFAASLDLLRLIGAKFELAETFLAGGELEVFDLTSRREFLKQAVLLFVRCGVTERAKAASLQLSRLIPKPDAHVDLLSTPLAEAYIACRLLQS